MHVNVSDLIDYRYELECVCHLNTRYLYLNMNQYVVELHLQDPRIQPPTPPPPKKKKNRKKEISLITF